MVRSLFSHSLKLAFPISFNLLKFILFLLDIDTDSAPLWDPAEQDFIGMITQTDLISLLLKYERRIRLAGDEDDEKPVKVDTAMAEKIQRDLVTQLDQNTIRASRSMQVLFNLPV